MGVRLLYTTPYHPQTDGQTERINQILEEYIRMNVNYLQDNWDDLLPMAQFAYNNHVNETTKMFPFFALHGYHPRFNATPLTQDEANNNPNLQDVISKIQDNYQVLQDNIAVAQERYKEYYNKRHLPIPQYKVGDQVYVSMLEQFSTTQPSKKLQPRR